MWGLRGPITGLILLGLLGIAGWWLAVDWRPAADDYPVQGIDVSHVDGAVDWKSVAAGGADFGYAVATAGANLRDPAFETNWHGLADAGMRRGAIHVWSFCRLAVDQANAFNTVVPRDDTALPAALVIDYAPDCDARPDRAVLLGELTRFLAMAETHLAKPLVVKISRAVERDYRLTAAVPRTVWAVGNIFPPDYAARPWRMWQASSFRHVDGVDGPVNWSVVRP